MNLKKIVQLYNPEFSEKIRKSGEFRANDLNRVNEYQECKPNHKLEFMNTQIVTFY